MNSRVLRWITGALGALFILSSLAITTVEAQRFNQRPMTFPEGSTIGGVSVGGLDAEEAVARVDEFYHLPLVLEINSAVIHAAPQDLGFVLDTDTLVSDALEELDTGTFWAFLWGELNHQPVEVPLAATVDEDAILNYLMQEIAPRYTRPGLPVTPIFNTTNYSAATTGESLDFEKGLMEIQSALLSSNTHRVELQTISGPDQSASTQMLQAFLQHNINWIGYNDLIEIYLESMSTGEKLQFSIWNGEVVKPDIAFPAASTNKIPIMISVLRRTNTPTPDEVIALFKRMIAFSENPPADMLMSQYLDKTRGPLIVSEDMIALGLENTFLGMYYTDETPLELYTTPANTRQDIFLNPDRFNQTTSSESGQLLSAIYTCAETGNSLLTETFPGEITQSECQLMVNTMSENIIGILIESGLPPEASAAHKHGYALDLDGQLRFMSDVAIVFTPGGDYVLNIFLHSPSRLDFDQGNRLIARLSQTVYNFFNVENQAYWWFD